MASFPSADIPLLREISRDRLRKTKIKKQMSLESVSQPIQFSQV